MMQPNQWLQRCSLVCGWIAAVGIAALPFVVAADFGGVLRWTQYLAAIGIVTISVLAMIGAVRGQLNQSLLQYVLLVPLALLVGFSLLQTIPLPASLVSTLSPASHAAYTQWAADILPDAAPTSFPISVSVHDSRHATAALALLLPMAAATVLAFQSRSRLILLMSFTALGGAGVAAFGIARITFPDAGLFAFTSAEHGAPFATFVNRNNAALMLNLGLAASLGLLSWRLMALTGQGVDDSHFEFNDLFALVSERESAVGMIGTVMCLVGLLASGSRGGLAAAVVGLLLALGWVRRRRGFISIPVVATAVVVAAAILIVPLSLDLDSIKRMRIFEGESQTMLNDGRFKHWPECWDAAMAHMPAGSGLMTYGYAYLPHQHSGVPAWFDHADNLWLELLTEQGVFGLALIVSAFGVVMRSLNRLTDSPDALDAGVQTMGWFAVGAILCSQFFDFGLMVPANSILVVVLASAIVAREVAVRELVDEPEDTDSRPLRFISRERMLQWKPLLRSLSIPAVALVIGLIAMPRLHRSAEVESLAYAADAQLDQGPTDEVAIERLIEQIRDSVNDDPPPQLTASLASLQYQLARLAEYNAARPTSLSEAEEVYEATGRKLRRLVHRNTGSRLRPELDRARLAFSESVDAYSSARQNYERSLRARPLDLNARLGLLQLDFVQPDHVLTQRLLEQLGRFCDNNAGLLVEIGSYAADSGHDPLAAKLWQSAASRDVNLMSPIFDLAALYPSIMVADVLPPLPRANRVAASKILNQTDRASWHLLPKLLEGLGCDQCESMQEKAVCHSLAGDIHFALQEYDDAFEQYVTSISMTPTDANLRLKVIRRMREGGRRRDALYQARLARREIPNDIRFQELITAMAESDIRELEQGYVRPTP